MGFGSPFPIKLGGGPSPSEQAYQQLRRAVGEGGSAADETGIDALWRMSKAKGLAAASSAERRALFQAFPELATDLLPYYERVLKIVPPVGASEADRSAVISERWYEEAVSSTDQLEERLQAIDGRLSLISVPEAYTGVAQAGRMFESHPGANEGPDFNTGRSHALFPNWSTRQTVHVRFDTGYDGPLNAPDQRILERVRRFLRLNIGSTVNFAVSKGPWHVGVTPIGLGEV